jgi:hypothetical protein
MRRHACYAAPEFSTGFAGDYICIPANRPVARTAASSLVSTSPLCAGHKTGTLTAHQQASGP